MPKLKIWVQVGPVSSRLRFSLNSCRLYLYITMLVEETVLLLISSVPYYRYHVIILMLLLEDV